MRLQPRHPPGRANRKAKRYTNDIRKMRAEGHSYETIRLALRDAGVSVSISTVRREAIRPPTQWELEHAQAEHTTLTDGMAAVVVPGSEADRHAVEPTPAAPSRLASSNAGDAIGDETRSRPGLGWLSGLYRAFRRLHRGGLVT